MRSIVYFALVRLIGALTGRGSVSELQLENAVLRHQVRVLRRTVRRRFGSAGSIHEYRVAA